MATRYAHARELRTIGQQLDQQNIDSFDLHYDNGDYVLECGDPNPPFTELVHLRYSSEELQSMELRAAQGRSDQFTLVKFETLAEILRTIGRKLDKLGAKLARISTLEAMADGTRFKIEYESHDGRYHTEDMVTSSITDLAIRQYKDRARIRGDSQQHPSAK